MSKEPLIIERVPLGFPWPTTDPFLFCVHHLDAYPAANAQMGPAVSLAGRQLGQDFEGKDGWRMYHGEKVPGFPQHPHRGFETITIARKGYIDHSDSLGATARFGKGDVQWMTAGAGVVHSEMFPLLDQAGPNPVELFQIWINLPAKSKMVKPYFTMFWNEDIQRHTFKDAEDRSTEVTVVAGELEGSKGPPPPPDSWASQAGSDVAVWCLRMDPHAESVLPPAKSAQTQRTLYFFEGSSLKIGQESITAHGGLSVDASQPLPLKAGDAPVEALLLQGKPIAEPVAHYGPFAMNTSEEIQQAMSDYRRTQFGGWPWSRHDPVHPREQGRFAKHAEGKVEQR